MKHRHNLSNYRLLTTDIGRLVPCGLVEVLPGDVFRHSASAMIRLAPMAAPVMHPMHAHICHFFVPHRLSWPDDYDVTWEQWITGGEDGTDATPFPTISTLDMSQNNRILDYLGIPQVSNIQVNALPLRAFNLIYNEWFRDQDLVPAIGLDQNRTVPRVAWRKDYFSTARPWPQKGEDVTVPLGGAAPVRGIGKVNQTFAENDLSVWESTGQQETYDSATLMDDTPNREFGVEESPDNPGTPNIWADLTQAVAARVLDVRRAFALQRFAENRARYGSRYAEYVRFGFGARPLDARLQRPEYFGGGTVPVSVSEVLQTAPDDTGDPRFGVGDLYGHGIALNRTNGYRRRFQEHGYVISCMFVRPKQLFSQGIERHWLRQDREDFYQRELAHIGQQQILTREVYGAADEDEVFGYSDRYAEYRQAMSQVHGEFRSELNYWHLGRAWDSPGPSLNREFVEVESDKRIFNEQTRHSLWCAVNHSIAARRVVSRNASGRII